MAELDTIIDHISHYTGMDLSNYDKKFLKRRIDCRMYSKGMKSYTDYASLLKNDPSESSILLRSLSINVTEFFRDPDTFQALEELICTFDKVRIWSAGCATGEEPYTIAIIVDQICKRRSLQYNIFASDISSKAINIAKEGLYTKLSLKNVSPDIIRTYFEQVDGCYKISPEIKRMVEFSVNNIINIQPPDKFDIIVCRNVMIYFSLETKVHLISKFNQALRTPGYLVLGKSETITGEASKLFNCIMTKERIYSKI